MVFLFNLLRPFKSALFLFIFIPTLQVGVSQDRDWFLNHLPPSHKDFVEITQKFKNSGNKNKFLRTIGSIRDSNLSYNKIAETLMLFQEKLTSSANLEGTIDDAYLHYVINTDGPNSLENEDYNVKDKIEKYANSFGLTIEKILNKTYVSFGKRKVECEECNGKSRYTKTQSLRAAGKAINYLRYGREDVIRSDLFKFRPQAKSYSKANATWLADFSELVYHDKSYVLKYLYSKGFQPKWIENRTTDTQCLIVELTSSIIVVFRGTSGIRDMLTDLNIRKLNWDNGQSKLHAGFYNAYKSVQKDILETLKQCHPHKSIFVTGHSLGAALAQIAAFDIQENIKEISGVYTFGSPRIGDINYSKDYAHLIGTKSFRHVNNKDVVTLIPLKWFGFRHANAKEYRFGIGHDFVNVSPSSITVKPSSVDHANSMQEKAIGEAERSVRQSTKYLTARTSTRNEGALRLTYGQTHDSGKLTDHGISQYLFKYACSIVEDKFKVIYE